MKTNRTFRATVLWTIVLVVAVVLGGGCKKKESPATPAKETTMKDMQMQTAKPVKDTNKTATTAAAVSVEQTTCPVSGDKIDKNVFVEYKGKKVYFCCASCESAFNKDPEKYISKLPQFAQ